MSVTAATAQMRCALLQRRHLALQAPSLGAGEIIDATLGLKETPPPLEVGRGEELLLPRAQSLRARGRPHQTHASTAFPTASVIWPQCDWTASTTSWIPPAVPSASAVMRIPFTAASAPVPPLLISASTLRPANFSLTQSTSCCASALRTPFPPLLTTPSPLPRPRHGAPDPASTATPDPSA